MPLPVSPSLLLAAAGLLLIMGRFPGFRNRWTLEIFSFIALLASAWFLYTDPVPSVAKVNGATVGNAQASQVWVNDRLAVSEQWVIIAFGMLSGISLCGSPRWSSGLGLTSTEQEQKSQSANHSANTCGFLLFIVAGLMLVARSNDFLSLGLSLEIVSLALSALKQMTDPPPPKLATNNEDGTDTPPTWTNWLASGFVWMGIALLTNAVATTQFDGVRSVLAASYDPGGDEEAIGAPSKLILLATGMIILGLSARMGLVPFHPGFGKCRKSDAVETSGLTMLAGQLAGTIALARLCGSVFVGLGQPISVLIMVVCLATFFLTAVMAANNTTQQAGAASNWLTCATRLQSAWLGVTLMTLTIELDHPGTRWGAFPNQNETISLIVFSQLTGILACGGICWTLSYLARADRGIEFAEDLKGLAAYAPGAAVALTVSLASSIGCPLMAGFYGRWLLMLAGHNVHVKSTSSVFLPHAGLGLVLLSGIVATVLMARVVVRLIREIVFESPLARPVACGGRGPLIAVLIASTATLILGIAPQLVLGPLRSVEAPRAIEPHAPQRGSGTNHSASRIRIRTALDISCQAKYASQVAEESPGKRKLCRCSWQLLDGSAQS